MGGEAMFEDDDGAAEIAADWGVDVELLHEAGGKLETIDSNDGGTVVYLVRFDKDTDPDLLLALGVVPGSFTRKSA
ncbi:hypothetical protein LB566_01250 [Mesorhizobium sp. CA13]|uniref:hypothetical protein n=1 Tax=Mesorhizobium sp. CA13 TaxID=2876643 RepID=UPI001CCB9030|nr:hypothetical protein [Mesorhizobium sp. CA13]MBZ9852405.1 hypothetical protein [Mesorhizobium sp. CA13]